jgi:carbon-monoxide dehydrogenase large subunit
MLHAAFARSPHPKARIRAFDISAAESAPGVVRVLAGRDLAGLNSLPANRVAKDQAVPPHPPLSGEMVYAVGVPVAVVVATSRYAAEDAAALIEVEYEPLESVVDVEEALSADVPRARDDLASNVCYTLRRQGGDLERAFAEAEHVTSVKIVCHRLAPVAMEPRGVAAQPQPMGQDVTVWLSTQAPNRARADLAAALGFPEHRIRVIAPDVGGGFGSKGPVYREDVVIAHLALQLGRPVRWVATRSEDLATTMHGRGMTLFADLALKRDGTMLGLKVRNLADLGAYLQSNTAGPPTRLLAMSPGCYRIPNFSAEVVGVFTNTVPTGPYRGAGRPESVLLIERVVDQAARELGIDPVEIRRKNMIRSEQFPYKTAAGAEYDSGDYERAMDKALKLAEYDDLLRERDRARAKGDLFGIGMSTFVEPSGGAGFESGVVRIERTGAVTAITGSSAHGQGHETVFAQVVAEKLGVPFDQVVVRHGDTAMIPQSVGTFGSRSASLGGSALVIAAERVVAKAKRLAAHLLEASKEDVVWQDGGFAVAGAPDRVVTWAMLADAAYRTLNLPAEDEPGLEATAYFSPEKEMYSYGTHLAAVRIDRETGEVRIEKLVAVDDCGVVLNPLVVEGQVQGGLAQGLGQALMEDVTFDQTGTLLTGTLMDYAVPRAEDMPPVTLGHTVTPSPRNPLGVKGVGESGAIGAPPAVVNAVVDALAPLGVRHVDMPFTAGRIWELIAAKQ